MIDFDWPFTLSIESALDYVILGAVIMAYLVIGVFYAKAHHDVVVKHFGGPDHGKNPDWGFDAGETKIIRLAVTVVDIVVWPVSMIIFGLVRLFDWIMDTPDHRARTLEHTTLNETRGLLVLDEAVERTGSSRQEIVDWMQYLVHKYGNAYPDDELHPDMPKHDEKPEDQL